MPEQEIRCHSGEWGMTQLVKDWRWKTPEDGQHINRNYRWCPYCGSVHPEDLQKALEAGVIRLGGSDWKYGFPHKFYVYPTGKPGSFDGKFYTKHLLDMDNESFNALAPLLLQHTGIEFTRDAEGKTMYKAPYHGYQR